MPGLLTDAKLRLRITNDAFDSEILDLLAAGARDLELAGVTIDTSMPLIKEALIIYCKGQFGIGNSDSEKYMNSYYAIKTHLVLVGGESFV